jgi:hypothetical protein
MARGHWGVQNEVGNLAQSLIDLLKFQLYYPSFEPYLGYWLLGCSIGGGSFGVFFGGFLSDRLVSFANIFE